MKRSRILVALGLALIATTAFALYTEIHRVPALFKSTVTVSGATTLSSTLAVTGASTLSGIAGVANGTVALPGLAFTSDLDCGLYRIGANNVGVSVDGAKVLDIGTTGLGITGTLSATGVTSLANGTVSLPAATFTSDPNTGIYRIGADNIGVTAAGAKVLDVSATGLGVTGVATVSSTLGVTGASTLTGGVTVGTGGSAITLSTKGTVIYDFPSLGGTLAPLNTICAESSAATVTGAAFGDVCSLGIDQVPVNAFGTLVAYVTAANAAKVQACAVGITDGGEFNMPDASYTVRCFTP